MKKLREIAAALSAVLIALSFVSCAKNADGVNLDFFLSPHKAFTGASAVSKVGEVSKEVRGMWIASVYNINFPSAPDLPEDSLKRELDSIVQNVLSLNMNTLFFQVHPASDALYESDIFPVSEFLYTDGILHFDPLEYMAKICRENDVSLIAWVNPLRVSTAAHGSEDEAKSALPENSPCRDGELAVFYGDGKLYLNCGKSEVRTLVADAVEEIVGRYDVDGIVFDDYFYPYPVSNGDGTVCEFDDSEEYASVGTEMELDDWRRDNVNQMIKECSSRVKSFDGDMLFGVAPFGIWQNDNGENNGSPTSGMEAYSALYCDAAAWISGGYIDFISPQLYWKIDDPSAPFAALAEWWSSLADGTECDLIVSHGAYRYDGEWDSPKGELVRQIELARHLISYKGSMLYGYAAVTDNAEGLADDTADVFSDDVFFYEHGDYPQNVMMNAPSGGGAGDMTVTFSGYSDPSHALLVNGKQVSRMQGGYFECRLSLIYGENEFTFTCGDASSTVTVIKNDNSYQTSE